MIEIANTIILSLTLILVIILVVRMKKKPKPSKEDSEIIKRYLDYLEKDLEEESKKSYEKN